MSGGVDSSVAALILKKRGYDVVGVTLHLWDYAGAGRNSGAVRGCCDISQQMDARYVCSQLGIPHFLLDMRGEFREQVVDPFTRSYLSGETPNPCVFCNSRVKWGAVLRRIHALEAEFVATGHYARVVHGEKGVRLLRGIDRRKDQSYALWEIPREALEKTLFPLGNRAKEQIRAEASTVGLRTAGKAESQEICFIDDHYSEHLRRASGGETTRIGKGRIVDGDGVTVGTHNGFFNFTIGQRRGLNIGDGKGPYFVAEIHPETNTVVIGGAESLKHQGCIVRGVNWVSYDPPVGPVRCVAKIRYNDRGSPAILETAEDGSVILRFPGGVRAVTPGQSAVWYRGESVWGGGIISRALREGVAAGVAAERNRDETA